MRAQEKNEALRRIVEEMIAVAEAGDWRRLERLNTEGYYVARGSRARQATLSEGYTQARAILERSEDEDVSAGD